MKRMKGIRKRWMMNSISAALLVVLLAVTSFSQLAMVSYYYSNLRTGLQSKITVAADIFSGYKTEADYYQNASAFVTGQFGGQRPAQFFRSWTARAWCISPA